MDQSDDVVLVLECDAQSDAVIIAANGAFCRASGFPDEQLIGLVARKLFLVATDAETLTTAIRDRVSLRTELACGRADGSTFMLGFHLMPAPERTRGRSCFVVLGRDITAQLEARRMQNSIQRLLAKVFMSVDEAVVIVSAAGRIMMTNSRIDQLLGYKPDELVGRDSLSVVPTDSRASIIDTIQKQMREGADQTYITPILKADGSRMVATITSVIVSTDDGKRFRILTLRSNADNPERLRTESAGRIKLVGLEEVRTAMGDRWQAVAERAMATAEAVIRRRCGGQDAWSRADNTSFLICFGAVSEQEASFRAAMIGREIHDRLIGQGSDADTACVRSIAAAIRFADQGESVASLHAILLRGLDEQIERVEREARRTLMTAFTGAACDLKRVFGRTSAETILLRVDLPPELRRATAAALAAVPANEAREFDLDGLLLGLAARNAVAAMARGDATPLLVNVRLDVFASRFATERYLATCLRIDQRVAGRLILLLSALPRGLPKTRLLECINRLRPFCRGIGYELDDIAGLLTIDLSFSPVPIVSFPVEAFAADEPEKLRTLFGSLHARRAKVLIREVASENEAAVFRSCGADMILMRDAAI